MSDFDDVSGALRDAFAALGQADLPNDDKARWHQRLIAITNMAKRDTTRAREQLARFEADWESEISAT